MSAKEGSPYEAKSLAESTYTKHAPASDILTGQDPIAPIPTEFQIRSEGIYQGLPVYDQSFHGKTALVAGANGISGTHMLRVMAQHPQIWTRVHSISRRPPQEPLPDHFQSHAIDLYNTTPDGVAAEIKAAGIKEVDYVFFYVFMSVEPEDKRLLFKEAEAICEANGKILDNFLDGIWAAGLRPKRVLVQTGGKGYGIHYGPIVNPAEEDDSANQRFFNEANFYYTHLDILWKFHKRTGVEWIDSRPSFIVGYVKDNNLNFFLPLLLYGAITKFMDKKELPFPGDRLSYDKAMDMSTAFQNAHAQEWSMLTKHAGNQSFHVCDGGLFYWCRLWPWLGQLFGLEAGPPPASDDKSVEWKSFDLYADANIAYPHRAKCSYRFLLSEWNKLPEVRQAWSEMAEKFQLDTTLMAQDYMWAIADFAITTNWPFQYSVQKSRNFGYFGNVDTWKALQETVDLTIQNKVIPDLRSL